MIKLASLQNGYYVLHFNNSSSIPVCLEQGVLYGANLDKSEPNPNSGKMIVDENEIVAVEGMSNEKMHEMREIAYMSKRSRDMQTVLTFRQLYETCSSSNMITPAQQPAPIHKMKSVEQKPMPATNIKPATISDKRSETSFINLPLGKK